MILNLPGLYQVTGVPHIYSTIKTPLVSNANVNPSHPLPLAYFSVPYVRIRSLLLLRRRPFVPILIIHTEVRLFLDPRR